MPNETEFVGFSEVYNDFFKSQVAAIENVLYGQNYNKQICTDLIGRLRGSVSFAFYYNIISRDELKFWEDKYKEYYSLNVERTN